MPNQTVRMMDETIRNIARSRAESAGFAWTMFNALKAQITEFETQLDPAHETAAWFANFGAAKTLVITSIGYRHPHLIVLVGEDENGNRQELLQHVSQVSLMLMSVPTKSEPARRIGFLADLSEGEAEQGDG